MKTLWRLFALFLISSVFTACSPILYSGNGEEKPLIVGVSGDHPPFVLTNDEGELAGVHVDMVRDLGLYLNRDVEIKVLADEEMVEALLSGSIDLMFPTLPVLEDIEGIAFSDPYAWMGQAFLTSADSVLDEVEDLNEEGRVIVVKKDSFGNQFARTALPQASIRILDDVEACVQEVMDGDADAFVHDALVIYDLVNARSNSLRAVLESFRRLRRMVGVRAEDEELLEAVNDFLFDYRDIGGFEKLTERYFKDVHEAFEVQGEDFIFDPPERRVLEDSESSGSSD